jgi:hypothetical protein
MFPAAIFACAATAEDCVQPGAAIGAGLIAGEAAPGFEISLLDEVFGAGGVSGNAASAAEEFRSVRQSFRFEAEGDCVGHIRDSPGAEKKLREGDGIEEPRQYIQRL